MKYVLFVGEMLIDLIPDPSGPREMRGYRAHPGGSVANTAIALARLGGASRFLGKLSEDDLGRMLLNVLQQNEVDIRYVPTTAQANTALALVTETTDGQRTFTFYHHRTADTLLEVTDLNPLIWENVAIVHTSSVLLAADPACSALLAAFDQAHSRGLPVSFDFKARPTLWPTEVAMRETMSQVLPRVDLFKCQVQDIHTLDSFRSNPTERRQLHEFGHQLLEQGPSLVVLTYGERGALLMTRQHTVYGTAPARAAIDTRGADDAFQAAILHTLVTHHWTTATQLATLNEEQLQELGAFATKVAGISGSRYGGIQSFPYFEEVERS